MDPYKKGVPAFRESARQMLLAHAPIVPVGMRLEGRVIAGRNGSIPVRIYKPSSHDAGKPVIVFFHGGAWVIGGLDEYDGLCAHMSSEANAVVVSVEYRLAPEYKFPCAVEDCFDAVLWVSEHLEELEASDTIAVAGDSAGGNLAAVVCQQAHGRDDLKIAHQLLFYPCLSPLDAQRFPSRLTYGGDENFLNETSFQLMLSYYRRTREDERDHRLWPILKKDLTGLPPAYIITAEFDMLRDEARAYANALSAAGVEVVAREYLGTIHGFMAFARTIEPGFDALNHLCAHIRAW